MTSDNARQRGPQATGTTSDNTKPSRATTVCRDYQYLSECSAWCEDLAAEVGNKRARKILTLLAERGRGVLAVIDAEPGLHVYLERLRREADAAAERERAETDRLHAEARRPATTSARS